MYVMRLSKESKFQNILYKLDEIFLQKAECGTTPWKIFVLLQSSAANSLNLKWFAESYANHIFLYCAVSTYIISGIGQILLNHSVRLFSPSYFYSYSVGFFFYFSKKIRFTLLQSVRDRYVCELDDYWLVLGLIVKI